MPHFRRYPANPLSLNGKMFVPLLAQQQLIALHCTIIRLEMDGGIMELMANPCRIEAANGAARITFFVVCEDWAAEFRANYFMDDISHRLGSDSIIKRNLWRLSLLRTPLLRERAAAEACRADAIVLALDKRTGVPGNVQEWLARILNGELKCPGLLGMVQEEIIDTDPPDLLVDYVRNAARQAGAAFFCWNELSECDLEDIISNLTRTKS